MKVFTWNVLHRVHAENYGEPAIARWTDEVERTRLVVELVSEAMAGGGFEVALLQEVSGDVFAALGRALPAQAVLHHQYPRMPRPRSEATAVGDLSEHLVVIAPKGSTVTRAQTFAGDPGKGVLAVTLPSGLVVASTHLSWGAKGLLQLETLAALLRSTRAPLCIGGDFNAERDVLVRALDADVVVATPVPGSARTRPDEADLGGTDIDHLLIRGAVLNGVHVLEHRALSDHRPVGGTVLRGEPLA